MSFFEREEFIAVSGQTIFTLSLAPDNGILEVQVNGEDVTDYILVDKVVTLSNPLKLNDQTLFTYVSGKYPAADGSDITNISGNSNTTNQGNTFNGISQLIQTTESGQYPALNGCQITGLTPLQLGLGIPYRDIPTVSDGQTVFTLYLPPFLHTDNVYKNGLILNPATDYTLSADSLTLHVATTATDVIIVTYTY